MPNENDSLRSILLSVLEKTHIKILRNICIHCITDDEDSKSIRELSQRDEIAVALVDHFSVLPRSLDALTSCIQAKHPKIADLIAKHKLDGEQPSNPLVAKDVFEFDLEVQPWYAPELPENLELIGEEEARSLREKVDVVIITATPIEQNHVMHLLDPYPHLQPTNSDHKILFTQIEQETYYLGLFGNYESAIMRCERGAAVATAAPLASQRALKLWRPRAVVMVGTAFGSGATGQKRGDILVASYIIKYNNDTSRPESNSILQGRFKEESGSFKFERPDGKFCEVYRKRLGPILSGETNVQDPELIKEFLERYPDAIGGEMEGAGLYVAAESTHTPWIW